MFLIYILIFIITFSIYYYYKNYYNIVKLAKQFKGPRAYPLIGNGLDFFGKSPQDALQLFQKLCSENDNFVRIWFGPVLNFYIADVKFCEKLLSSQKLIDKSNEYDFLRPWLNEGLLMSTGKKWQNRRKAITPTFHFSILEQFVEIFNAEGITFINVLKKYKPNENIDIFPLVTLYALDVICRKLFNNHNI